MIIVHTAAYNAAHTLRRTIESILNQTYSNFIYSLTDNGSTDNTGEIIKEYAVRDSRINPLRNKINRSGQGETANRVKEYDGRPCYNDYFVYLDADDEYKSDFLEKMVRFCEDNKLDIAFCGSEYIYTDGHQRFDTPPNTRVMTGGDIVRFLPEYYQYATRFWGVFFNGHIKARLSSPRDLYDLSGMWDSKGVLRALEHAKRVGVLAENLHKYYRAPNTLSRAYNPNWFWWVNEMYEQTRMFILSRSQINDEFEKFLWVRYLIWIKYISPRIQNTNASMKVRARDIVEIFESDRTVELLQQDWQAIGITSNKEKFLREYITWITGLSYDDSAQPYVKRLICLLERYLREYCDV